MVLFRFLLLAAAAIVYVGALSSNEGVPRAVGASLLPPAIPPPSLQGYSDGFYYLASSSNYPSTNISFTNGPAGKFDFTWGSNNARSDAGKGWNPGSRDRIINYSGAFRPSGISYLWLHGWTTNPLIEYFIVESNGGTEGHPYSAASIKAWITCDNATYMVRKGTRYDIRVDGVLLPITQFWSVRLPFRQPGPVINGTINTTCHFNEWKTYGMDLGTEFDYQVLSVDNNYSGGFANLTVTDGTVAS